MSQYLRTSYCLILLTFATVLALGDDVTPSTPDEGGFTDNAQTTKNFSTKLQELQKDGKVADMETLREQLARKRCDTPLPAPVAPGTLEPTELYEYTKRAFACVGSLYKCKKCSKWHIRVASGFMVSPDGVILTNYHVVDNETSKAMGVMTQDGKVYPVKEVLAASEADDVAAIRIDVAGLPYLSMSLKSPIGSKVWVLSNPHNNLRIFTDGIVSGRHIRKSKKGRSKRITITADYGVGSSGSPVVNEKGLVIGMASSTVAIRTEKDKKNEYTQMTLKHCIPAELMLDLFREDVKSDE